MGCWVLGSGLLARAKLKSTEFCQAPRQQANAGVTRVCCSLVWPAAQSPVPSSPVLFRYIRCTNRAGTPAQADIEAESFGARTRIDDGDGAVGPLFRSQNPMRG